MKQIPIDTLFKYNQEPIYIVNLTLSYEEFLDKCQLDYEVWQEDGLGNLIGAALDLGEYKYFLKTAKDHIKPHTQVAVYVLAGTENLEEATEVFLSSLNILNDEVDDVGKYFYGERWQVVRETVEDGNVVVDNYKNESEAIGAQKSIQRKYEDKFFVRKFSGAPDSEGITKQTIFKCLESWECFEMTISEEKEAFKVTLINNEKSVTITMPYEVGEFHIDFVVDSKPFYYDWYEIMDESLSDFMSYTQQIAKNYLYQEVRVNSKGWLFKTRELQYKHNDEWCNVFN
jgi:hypothetical protein